MHGTTLVPFYTDLGSQPIESSVGLVEPAWRGAHADLYRPRTINIKIDRSGQPTAVKMSDANVTLSTETWSLFLLAFTKKCKVAGAMRFGHGRASRVATFGSNKE